MSYISRAGGKGDWVRREGGEGGLGAGGKGEMGHGSREEDILKYACNFIVWLNDFVCCDWSILCP